MKELNLFLVLLFVLLSLIVSVFCKPKDRWIVLLVASLGFYYLLAEQAMLIPLSMACLVYLSGFLVGRKFFKIWMPVLVLLIPLIAFKIFFSGGHFYSYHYQDKSSFIETFHWSVLLRVIGISYFTFNAISYLIDLNRRYVARQDNFFKLLLYLFYFPSIFSGPLHRIKYFDQQVENIEISERSISRGLRLILWGLFKNIVIAQRLFLLLDSFYYSKITGAYYLVTGTLFFIYLYCNFSSFIDFFRGVSALFGIELKENFRSRVYLSSSRQEFWKGWHITLNEWFRDYFFYVLFSYDKKKKYADYILLLTFLAIALWHELTWAMLIWGTCNGLWIILEKRVDFKKWPYPEFRKIGGVVYHLAVASLLALIFITPDSRALVAKLFSMPDGLTHEFLQSQLSRIAVVTVAFVIMDYYSRKAKEKDFDSYLNTQSRVVRWSAYLLLSLLILLFGISPGIDNYYVQF